MGTFLIVWFFSVGLEAGVGEAGQQWFVQFHSLHRNCKGSFLGRMHDYFTNLLMRLAAKCLPVNSQTSSTRKLRSTNVLASADIDVKGLGNNDIFKAI